MPGRKAPAKKAAKAPKKAAAKQAGATKRASRAQSGKAAAKGARASRAPAASAPPASSPSKKAARRPPAERTRVVVPMGVYEAQKDAIKAPFKEHGLKWTFLGEGKGLYKRPDGGVHCFTQFKDDGVHYSVWGEDRGVVDALLASWRATLGEEGWARATATGEQAAAAEKAQEETEAMRLWRLAQPQRRPGEPDFFFQRRLAEWEARRPA